MSKEKGCRYTLEECFVDTIALWERMRDTGATNSEDKAPLAKELGMEFFLHHCPCCEYAARLNQSLYFSSDYCKDCPLQSLWGNDETACLHGNSPYRFFATWNPSGDFRLGTPEHAQQIIDACKKELARLRGEPYILGSEPKKVTCCKAKEVLSFKVNEIYPLSQYDCDLCGSGDMTFLVDEYINSELVETSKFLCGYCLIKEYGDCIPHKYCHMQEMVHIASLDIDFQKALARQGGS